jgi:hypothetical protein
MPTDDRDRQLERALARHLRASADAACPDAEILAAYHERTLSFEEMAEWKDHIARCSRCQEALVFIEESENALADPAEPEVPVSEDLGAWPAPEAQAARWRTGADRKPDAAAAAAAGAPVPMETKRPPRLNWRWVAPLGALAAAVILWVGVRDLQIAKNAAEQSVQSAQNREPPVPGPPPPLAAHSSPPPSEGPTPRKDSSVPKTSVPQSPRSPLPAAPTAVQSQKEEQAAGNRAAAIEKSAPSQQAYQQSESPEMAAPKPHAAEPAGMVTANEMKKSRAAEVAPGPPAAVGGAAGAPANKPGAADKLELPHGVGETVERTAPAPALNSQSDLQMAVRDSQVLLRLAAEDHRLIVAPGQKQVWRVGEGGSISHSTDGAKTWKKQNSGVTVDLTSGSATSDKVAWITGRNGTLLLTTDGGKHWKQISTPITGDLGGVHAADATHASIWDVPNRKSFETSDGGETWKPSANE